MEKDERTESGITEDGSVDLNGNPAVKALSGGWTSASILLGPWNFTISLSSAFQLYLVLALTCRSTSVNQSLVTLAFFGVGVNMVLFLTRVLRQDVAEAANNVSTWTGTVYIFSLIGAFLSDSYWGRYLTCAVFQIIFILVREAKFFNPPLT